MMKYKVGTSKLVKGELGVFASKSLRNGDIIGFMNGVELDPRDEFDHTHILWLEDLPVLITNELKYVNHSSNPNCQLEGMILTAIKPIKKGEELTWHYGDNFEAGLH